MPVATGLETLLPKIVCCAEAVQVPGPVHVSGEQTQFRTDEKVTGPGLEGRGEGEARIRRAWDTPVGSSGKSASASVTLSDSGTVLSVVVNASDPDMKASIAAAVRAAAPYPMPSDPDARSEARRFTSTFRSQ